MADTLHNREAEDLLIDARISIILRAGMIISAIVIAIGGLLYLRHHGGVVPDYSVFHGIAAPLTNIHGIVHAALHGSDIAETIMPARRMMLMRSSISRSSASRLCSVSAIYSLPVKPL